MYGNDYLAPLVGTTVKELWISNDGEHEARIATDGGTLCLPTEGECCSESWWADAFGVKQMLGAKVTAAEWIEMPTPKDGRTRQEEDEAYGLRVTTDKGVCDLVFRNSSNGYYGGWSSPSWEPDGTMVADFRLITEDWSA